VIVSTPFELDSLIAEDVDMGRFSLIKAHLAVSLYLFQGVVESTSSARTLTIPSPSLSTSTLSSKLISAYKPDRSGQIQDASPEDEATGSPSEYGDVNDLGDSDCRVPIDRSRRQKDDWEHVLKSSCFTPAAKLSSGSAASSKKESIVAAVYVWTGEGPST
jgi:hypothetical protein